MTYETLGDFQSQSPVQTSTEDIYSSREVTAQMPCLSKWGRIVTTLVLLFHSVFPLLLLLSLPSTQPLGYEEKRQSHRSIENVPTGAHGPSGAAHHWTFSTRLLSFLHLSFSQPSLLGKLEIGVNVYTVSHAARCHCLPVYLQSHGRKKGRRL